jgi:hypothetical protein
MMFGFRGGEGTLKGNRASRVIIQGDMVVAKDLPLSGPNGVISRDWISRALILY